jgi:hypothetical protein
MNVKLPKLYLPVSLQINVHVKPLEAVQGTIMGHSLVIRSHILPPLHLQMHDNEVALALHERITDRRYYERNNNTNQPTNKK